MLNCNAPLEDDKPTSTAPICNDGAEANPVGNNKLPLSVPPVNGKFKLEFPVTFPVKLAVIIPAEKLPDASLATMAKFVFAEVAVVATFAINKGVFNVNNLSFEIDPASFAFVTFISRMSIVAIKEVDKAPETLL